MPITNRYLVVKGKDKKEIKYFEYDKINGYDIKPNVKIKDAIHVNRMILINPSLISKMAEKKIDKKFNTLLQLLRIIYESDDDTGSTYQEALNEIERLRVEANNKYRKYMEEEKYEVFLRKLSILELDVKTRLEMIVKSLEEERSMGGKGR